MTSYTQVVSQKLASLPDDEDESPDALWGSFKVCLTSAAEHVCGMSRKHNWRRETWWWNDEVEAVIKKKRRAFKVWKQGVAGLIIIA